MANLMFIALFIALYFTSLGESLQCYKCENCSDAYEKVSCDADESCVTIKTTAWILGGRREDITKKCAASNICDEKNAKEQKEAEAIRNGPYIVADYAPRKFECVFCNTDLCNDGNHKI